MVPTTKYLHIYNCTKNVKKNIQQAKQGKKRKDLSSPDIYIHIHYIEKKLYSVMYIAKIFPMRFRVTN